MRVAFVVFGLVLVASVVAAYPQPESVECDICKGIVSEIENAAKLNKTEAEIRNELQQKCDQIERIVPFAKPICDAAESNLDQILQLINQDLSPDDVCALLGVCTSVNFAPGKEQNPVQCAACKQFVAIAERELTSNATEARIREAIDETCAAVEKAIPEVQLFCRLADANVDKILKALIAKHNATEICTSIGECGSKHLMLPFPRKDTHTTCQAIADVVQDSLKANKSETEISNAVGVACRILETVAPQANPECTRVLENISVVVNLLRSAPSKDPCAFLSAGDEDNPTADPTEPSNPNDQCSTCTTIAGLVESLAKQNKTEEEIQKMVTQACVALAQFLPSISTECDAVVAQLPTILEMLANAMTPEEVCAATGFCSKAAVPFAEAPKARRLQPL